jgi:alpha-tubulin suppressor-like RCC1 family protein
MTKRPQIPARPIVVRRWIGIVASAASLLTLGVTTVPARASTTPGAAYSWGANAYGELGDGTKTDRSSPVSVHGLPLGGVTSVAAGARQSYAIRCDGSLVAWGGNSAGELGIGKTSPNSTTPVQVIGLGAGSGVIAVDGNALPLSLTNTSVKGHSMALKSNGSVLGWGNNTSGEVGNGVASTIPVLLPATVKGLGPGSGVVAIAAGGSFSMALKKNGEVLAWGNNKVGELGNGTLKDHPTPTAVSGLGAGSGVVAIAAGTSFALALKSNGSVWAWGNDKSGELGNGANTNKTKPVQVSGLGSGSGVTAISAGDSFAVALKSDGSVLAWGNNGSGELGDGNGGSGHTSNSPVNVSGLGSGSGVVQIATGFAHALARTSSGSLYAWGDDHSGQLGDGGSTDQSTPESLGSFTNATAVSAGGAHTLALHALTFTTTVSVGNSSIMEGDANTRSLTFPVTLSQPSSTKVTVDYSIAASGKGGGFAKPGTDFKATRGTVTFTPSSKTGLTPVQATVTTSIYSNAAAERKEKFHNEVFKVVLSSPCSCVLGRSVAQGTIIDHHASLGATVGIGGGSLVVGSGTGRRITFPITLSKPVANKVTVHYTVADVTAVHGATCSSPGADYSGSASGTRTFVVSRKTGLTKVLQKVIVSICPDGAADPGETFTVTLSGLRGLHPSQLAVPSTTATILGA